MFDDRTPIYRRIAKGIEHEILSGMLREEEHVMSTIQYAAHFRINRTTAQKAFQQLVDDGTLSKRRGIGMFVSPGATARLRSQRRARFFADVVDPPVSEAKAIGVPPRDVVPRIHDLADEDER